MTGYTIRYAEPPEGYEWRATGRRDPAYSLEKIQAAPRQPAAAQPLALPVIAPEVTEAESGRLPPPAQAAEAAAQTPLNAPQQAMVIGEPIPVVFCRRRDNIGGVLLFPKATEAAFSNTSTQQTARYHCVLGMGPMGSVQVRDFRVGACRVGTFSQNFDKRAGTWSPGNTATPQAGYQVPTFPTATGGGGSYAGLSTLEFSSTTTGGSDDWRLGCNVFAREGLTVTRLLGGSGGSDNFADLVLWALQRSGRVPASLIDTASFTAAATFLDVNGLFCNGEFVDSANLGDWLLQLLPYFLLRQTKVGGKFALRPLVPTNSDGTINVDTIAPDWVLTESVIAPGSFSQQWSDAGTRLAPRLTMLWRQQDETSIPIVRSLIVGLDRAGPTEQHDLSRFCASEIHAARVGAYLHGRRYLSTHTASLTLIPGNHTGRIKQGDVVVVRLPLTTGREADGLISDWYAVESVALAADGSEALTLSHFPVDSMARSLLALQVANATAPGILLPFAPTGACDVAGRSADASVPASTTSGSSFRSQYGGSGSSGAYNFSRMGDRGPSGEGAPSSTPTSPATPGGQPIPLGAPPPLEVGESVPQGFIKDLNDSLNQATPGGEYEMYPAGKAFPSGTWQMVFKLTGGGYCYVSPGGMSGGCAANDNSTVTLQFSGNMNPSIKIHQGFRTAGTVAGEPAQLISWSAYIMAHNFVPIFRGPNWLIAWAADNGAIITEYTPSKITVVSWTRIS